MYVCMYVCMFVCMYCNTLLYIYQTCMCIYAYDYSDLNKKANLLKQITFNNTKRDFSS